jgi:hypothetical protein
MTALRQFLSATKPINDQLVVVHRLVQCQTAGISQMSGFQTSNPLASNGREFAGSGTSAACELEFHPRPGHPVAPLLTFNSQPAPIFLRRVEHDSSLARHSAGVSLRIGAA